MKLVHGSKGKGRERAGEVFNGIQDAISPGRRQFYLFVRLARDQVFLQEQRRAAVIPLSPLSQCLRQL